MSLLVNGLVKKAKSKWLFDFIKLGILATIGYWGIYRDMAGIETVNAMSVQDTTTGAGRSVLGDVLHWVGVRFAGYLLVMFGSVLAFFIWATFYTYVWPGKPPISIEAPAPTPVNIPAVPDPTPIDDSPAIALVLSDVVPIAQLKKLFVYGPSNEKVGQIEDVLVGNDGKVVAYIVGVGGGFLGGQQKDISVPLKAVEFKKQDNTWTPILYMSKDAVQQAPRQKFDGMMWVPDPAR